MFAIPAAAQTPRPYTLTTPGAEAEHGFFHVSGVYQLRDGRVVAVDEYDRSIFVVDFANGSVTQLGRNGAGPREYGRPRQVLALGGDSAAVMDVTHRRLLVITPEGRLGEVVNLRERTVGGAPMPVHLPEASDRFGRFYTQAAPIAIHGGQRHVADSAAFERWSPLASKRDTVAFVQVRNRPGAAVVGGMVASPAGSPRPFLSHDQWAVDAEGRVGLVHLDPYRVHFVEPSGARVAGPPIPVSRVRLTDEHKALWRERQRRPRPATVLTRGGASRTAMMRMPYEEPGTWPEYLPTFLPDAVSFAPNGLLWVRRTTPADEPPIYDLIGADGRVVKQVQIPARARVVGYGPHWVYVVRLDADDIEHLQRYPLPGA